MERSESSKGKENQKGQDNSHAERASWEQILGPRRNPGEKKKKNPSPGRGLLYVLRVIRGWLSKGAPPPAGTLQKEFFFFCPGSANFLLPLSQGSEAPRGWSGRTLRLGSHRGSLPGAGTDLLGKYRSFDNSCLTSLLGFFPYTLRKRSCPSLCPQIQTLFFCGGLHGNRYLFLIPTHGTTHF